MSTLLRRASHINCLLMPQGLYILHWNLFLLIFGDLLILLHVQDLIMCPLLMHILGIPGFFQQNPKLKDWLFFRLLNQWLSYSLILELKMFNLIRVENIDPLQISLLIMVEITHSFVHIIKMVFGVVERKHSR